MMSLASKIGTVIGTATAYVIHYMGKGSTPLGLATIVYSKIGKIQDFAILDRSTPDAIQDNLFECLQYIN
jgi:hypothetical protein